MQPVWIIKTHAFTLLASTHFVLSEIVSRAWIDIKKPPTMWTVFSAKNPQVQLQTLGDLFDRVGFDCIACIEVGEVLRTYAALLTLTDFGCIILESLERTD